MIAGRRTLLSRVGLRLPYSIDFTGLGNGGLPAPFLGPTFAISGGKVINTPTLGDELLTDPGLEANYTGEACDTLTVNGSPTLAQSADAHGGSKAQQFTATAFNDRLNWPTVAGVAGAWYLYSVWAKRTAGSNVAAQASIFQSGSLPNATSNASILSASYNNEKISVISTGTGLIYCYPAKETGSSAFCTVIVDDGSLKRLTYATLFALLKAEQSDIVAKVIPDTLADQTLSGIVLRANSDTSPTDYLLATWRYTPDRNFITMGLTRCVAGVYTQLVAEAAADIVADAWFEIRASGSTVSIWYNNAQIGTDQSDSTSGKYHGMLITGGNNIKRFFLSAS